MEEGEIEVDSVLPIRLDDITPELARASGFKGVVDLLKVAKHGRGEQVYLVRFHYEPSRQLHGMRIADRPRSTGHGTAKRKRPQRAGRARGRTTRS